MARAEITRRLDRTTECIVRYSRCDTRPDAKALMTSLVIWLCILCGVLGGTESIRAAWIAHIQCPDEAQCQKVIQSLAEHKVNRVYVCVWNNGRVFFQSDTMYHALGKAGIGPDILGWTLKYAQQYGIKEVFAWFEPSFSFTSTRISCVNPQSSQRILPNEYGLMASYETIETPFGAYAMKQGWVLGKYLNFWYMSADSAAVDFVGNLMKDAAARYKPGAVQLDDHFDCPHVFAICQPSVMHKAARTVWSIVRTASSSTLSLSPMPLPNSIQLSNVDWPKMLEAGFFTEVVPQFYTISFAVYKAKIEENEKYLSNGMKELLLCGVRVNGSGPLTEWKEVKSMIEYANSKHYGVVIWYSRGIFLDYPQQFHELWH